MAVFKEIQRALGQDFRLEEVVLDFEQACWIALRQVFNDIKLFGCLFHYNQAIFRNVQKLGLAVPYKNDQVIKSLVKSLFSLPFLPSKNMVQEFKELKPQFEATRDNKMNSLYDYVKGTWFESSVWKPRDLCGYHRLVRTNNDVEGYHRRLNQRCGNHPPVYKLLKVLHDEARLVDITAKLVSNHGVCLHRKKQTKEAQARVLEIWDLFEEGQIDAKEVLMRASSFAPF